MTVRLVCRKCGKRLKVPDGVPADRTARCPKCSTPVDLAAARAAARAYAPTPLLGSDDPLPYLPPASPKPAAPPKPVPKAWDDTADPLPYLPAAAPTPKSLPPKPSLPPRPTLPPAKAAPKPPPLPPPAVPAPLAKGDTKESDKHQTPNTKHETPKTDEVLSLDDDPAPAEVEPFRVPVSVLADSLTAHVGTCVAVLLPHGLFFEHEPMKPFLYIPPGAAATCPAAGELTAVLPDGRTVTMRFEVRYARALARDARAFLAGERPVPHPAEYRRKWWMLWAALMFALGLAGGPLVLSQVAKLGIEFGLKVGAGFAAAGLLVNLLIVLFSRRPVFVQLVVMACACVAVTGLFLFGATAYLAGRQRALDEARAEAQATPPTPGANTPTSPNPPAEPKPPEPAPDRPPSHLDRARKSGSSALDDGPDNVTSLALSPDGKLLAVGHADGAVRMWPLDQATFDPYLPGPKGDGAVSRVQFVAGGRFVFAHTATGAIGAPVARPPAAPAKLPGTAVALAPELDGDRLRFAAVRNNLLQFRTIRDAFIDAPPPGKGFTLPGKGDEVIPAGAPKDGSKVAGPTFLAWSSGGRVFAGLSDGTVNTWAAMRPEAPSRDHKSPVKAWADSPSTGDFATGDDAGNVGIWGAKGGKPVVSSVLATPVTNLSFGPGGTRLAVTDATGWLVIWDVREAKAVHRVKRATPLKAVALGPGDEFVTFAFGKTVEVWRIADLVK
jgi:hypothetical protein